MNIEYTTEGGRRVSVDVHEATVRMNLKRAKVLREVTNAGTDVEEFEPLEGILRITSYPTCIAASTGLVDTDNPNMSIEDLTFEAFIDLPAKFVNLWTDAVNKLNPDWNVIDKVPLRRPSSEGETSK